MTKLLIKPGNALFFLGLLLLECANFFVNVSFLSPYLKILKIISFIILIFSGFIINGKDKKLSLKNCLILLALLFISMISFNITKSTMFLEILLVSFNALGINFTKVVKMDLYIKLFIILFVTSMSRLGYATSDFIVTRSGEYIRDAYGFYHPNTFGMILMMTFFDFVYLRRNKIGYKEFILSFLLIIFIRNTCDTRTVIYCIILFMICILFRNMFKFKNKVLNFIKNNMCLIFLILSIITTLMYMENYPLAIQLNKILSNRLSLQAFFFNLYDINIIGNKIDFIKTLDNGYLKIILNYGLITTIFLIIIYNLNLRKATKFKEKILIIIYLIILVFSISESTMFYIYNNIFMIYFLCTKEENNEKKAICTNTLL